MLRDYEKEKLAGDDERPDIITYDRNASRFYTVRIYSTYSFHKDIIER